MCVCVWGPKLSIMNWIFVAQNWSTCAEFLLKIFPKNKPIGASPRRWLDSCCLCLLCCDHDDHVVSVLYNGYGNSMSIYVRNPFASLKWLSCLWMFTKVGSTVLSGLSIWVYNFGGFVSSRESFWRVCLVSFWRETDIHRNSYMMDNFGRQKFNSDGQFWASHTQTHRRTHS